MLNPGDMVVLSPQAIAFAPLLRSKHDYPLWHVVTERGSDGPLSAWMEHDDVGLVLACASAGIAHVRSYVLVMTPSGIGWNVADIFESALT